MYPCIASYVYYYHYYFVCVWIISFLHYIILKENVNIFSDVFLIFKAMQDY